MATVSFKVREFQKGSKQFLWPNNSSARNLANKNTHVQKNSAPGTLASSLFFEHTRHTPTLGHLAGACPLPQKALLSDVCTATSLLPFKPVLKCRLIKEAYPYHLI